MLWGVVSSDRYHVVSIDHGHGRNFVLMGARPSATLESPANASLNLPNSTGLSEISGRLSHGRTSIPLRHLRP